MAVDHHLIHRLGLPVGGGDRNGKRRIAAPSSQVLPVYPVGGALHRFRGEGHGGHGEGHCQGVRKRLRGESRLQSTCCRNQGEEPGVIAVLGFFLFQPVNHYLIHVFRLSVLRRYGDGEHGVTAAGTQILPVHPAQSPCCRFRKEGHGLHLIGDRYPVGKAVRVKHRVQHTIVRHQGKQTGIAAGRLRHPKRERDIHAFPHQFRPWAGDLIEGHKQQPGTCGGVFHHPEPQGKVLSLCEAGAASGSREHSLHFSLFLPDGHCPLRDGVAALVTDILKHLGIIFHVHPEGGDIAPGAIVGKEHLHHISRFSLCLGEAGRKSSRLGAQSPQRKQHRPTDQTQRKLPSRHSRSPRPQNTAILRKKIIPQKRIFFQFLPIFHTGFLFFSGGQLTEWACSFTIIKDR